MNEQVSSRHKGDLGGFFLPFGSVDQVNATVSVSPEYAAMANSQHTAWMVVNLLARLKGVVRSIGLQCPKGIRLSGNVVPFARATRISARPCSRAPRLLELCRWSRTLNMNTRSWLVRRMARWTREVCSPMAMAGAAVFPIHRSTHVASKLRLYCRSGHTLPHALRLGNFSRPQECGPERAPRFRPLFIPFGIIGPRRHTRQAARIRLM